MTSPIGPDARPSTPTEWRRSGRVSARLPRHLRDARHRRGRPRHARRRRSRPSVHARLSLREGESLRRAHVSPRPAAVSAAPRRAKGQRTVRADLVGRGARRDRRAAERDRASRADGPQAILPYSYAGTMGLLQGSSMDRRFFHTLGASMLDRTICSMAGTVGHADDGRREHRRRSRRDSRERSRAAVGHEHADVESASVAVRARGARARRADHRDRSDPHAHRGAVRRVDPDPPRHRRRARARDDARALRSADSRIDDYLARAHARHRAAARARSRVHAGARRGDHRRCRRRPSCALGERYGRANGGVHPRELRPAASRRRRDGGAHDRLSAGVDRPLAARRRRRAALLERELRVQHARRSSVRTCRRRCARST